MSKEKCPKATEWRVTFSCFWAIFSWNFVEMPVKHANFFNRRHGSTDIFHPVPSNGKPCTTVYVFIPVLDGYWHEYRKRLSRKAGRRDTRLFPTWQFICIETTSCSGAQWFQNKIATNKTKAVSESNFFLLYFILLPIFPTAKNSP